MNIRQEILSLTKKTSKELRKMYEIETGSKVPPYRREYFIKWLAYRMQEKVYGGLSEKATKQLDYLTEEMRRGRKVVSENSSLTAGTRIVKKYRGEEHEVIVKGYNSFIYRGKPYKSLSAIANEITGTRWSGLAFFGLKNAKAN
ncbi:DUF2924 domain-containing protein [Wolbachia pipientis]|uniref:DUF2924 domain-containing protein n=1 Tax=Wolbachia pipientis TaxID=955 RepID=UPI0020B69BF7|nr:DUF2924 domain-containing protein [Wolbachia pipientis]